MPDEELLSVGIDIGTSTTQCVFSRLRISNTAPVYSIPKVQITKKTVVYRAPLRLTPLVGSDTVNAEALKSMILEDYRSAGVLPKDVKCGAVIITGETARRQNARAVLDALSGLAGDFVVATAGPELESVLAGRGSGAAALSAETGKPVLNLDIGGGTANICLFQGGEPVAAGCMHIGGRLLRFEIDDRTVLSFTDKMRLIAEDCGIRLKTGEVCPPRDIGRICGRMAALLEETAGLREKTPLHDRIVLARALPPIDPASLFTFSGGVADCIYGTASSGIAFHDLGEALGRAIASGLFFSEGRVLRPAETQHATVIGAGAYSVSVSGSTIFYNDFVFPVRNLPVAKVSLANREDIPPLTENARGQMRLLGDECALGFEGIRNPGWAEIESIADALAPVLRDAPVRVLIIAQDMAKALGQALLRRLGPVPMICMDGVSLAYGDTVDIGAPLSGGRVLPIVVKTLAFAT